MYKSSFEVDNSISTDETRLLISMLILNEFQTTRHNPLRIKYTPNSEEGTPRTRIAISPQPTVDFYGNGKRSSDLNVLLALAVNMIRAFKR